MQVSIKTAERVTKGLDRLEDILVLHLNNGKDYFVSSVCVCCVRVSVGCVCLSVCGCVCLLCVRLGACLP